MNGFRSLTHTQHAKVLADHQSTLAELHRSAQGLLNIAQAHERRIDEQGRVLSRLLTRQPPDGFWHRLRWLVTGR